MPSQWNNPGPGGPWGSGARPDSENDKVFRQGQDKFKQFLPSGGPRGMIVLAMLAFAGVGVWTAYFTVPSDSVAVVQRFGKYLREVPPGCISSCRSASMSRRSFPSNGS